MASKCLARPVLLLLLLEYIIVHTIDHVQQFGYNSLAQARYSRIVSESGPVPVPVCDCCCYLQ